MEKDASEKIGALICQNISSMNAAGVLASPPSSTTRQSSALRLQSTHVTRSRILTGVSPPLRLTPSFRDSSATFSHSKNLKASTPRRSIIISHESPVVTVSINIIFFHILYFLPCHRLVSVKTRNRGLLT